MKKYSKIIVFILILLVSIGFAYLSTQLDLLGNTTIKKQRWDIHFENIQVTDGSVEAELPVIDTNRTRVDYSVTLDKPGDFYEFTVDAKNAGTIDAVVDTVTNSTLSSNISKYVTYTLTYKTGDSIVKDDIIEASRK